MPMAIGSDISVLQRRSEESDCTRSRRFNDLRARGLSGVPLTGRMSPVNQTIPALQ